VLEGAFRQDLYQRLSVFVIHVPALRERKCDIPALSHSFLSQIGRETGPRELSSAALARLCAYAWPGNVRELRNVLYRAALRTEGQRISAADISESLATSVGSPRAILNGEQARALVRGMGGNVSAAARQAGVARSTFRGWLCEGEPES